MTESGSDQYVLTVIGAPDLRAPDGRRVKSVLSQPKRLGLLTYLALASGPVSRARVAADFWPESDEALARNALSQALFYLRRSLDADAVRSVEGDRLLVPPQRVWCDAREVLSADEPMPDMVDSGEDELLAGWSAESSRPLQEWLDGRRREIRSRIRAWRELRTPVAEVEPEPLGDGAPERRSRGVSPGRSGPSGGLMWAAVGSGVVATLLVFRLAGAFDSGGEGEPPGVEDLAVLAPSVMHLQDAPTLLSARAIGEEVRAQLPALEHFRVVSLPGIDSWAEMTRQLDAIGTQPRDAPEWTLVVSVRVARTEARVICELYRGATRELTGCGSFDVGYATPEEALLDAPRAIGDSVSSHVARVLGGPAGRT